MSGRACDECRAIAPELALGIASGDERATALRHLAGCPECRDELRPLTDAADLLLLAAPDLEPSAGFDQRVVAGWQRETAPPRWTRRAVVATCAAVVLVAVACGAVAGWITSRPDAQEQQYAAALDDMNGQSMRVAPFDVDARASRVVAYDGDPSWLLVMVDGGLQDGEYSIVCEYAGGWSLSPGTVSVQDGKGSWATTVHRTLGDLTAVQLQDAAGAPVAGATFD